MFELRSHSKLRADHLARPALIYIRQSTLMQVRENTASTARQYQLARRVHELGWPEQLISVLDQDQGQSGASAVGRTGFEHLIAEVGLGRAGAVVSLEASRLARSSSDWYRLIEICALTDTVEYASTDPTVSSCSGMFFCITLATVTGTAKDLPDRVSDLF